MPKIGILFNPSPTLEGDGLVVVEMFPTYICMRQDFDLYKQNSEDIFILSGCIVKKQRKLKLVEDSYDEVVFKKHFSLSGIDVGMIRKLHSWMWFRRIKIQPANVV